MLDFLFSFTIITLGFLFIKSRRKLLIKDKKILNYIWFYHLFFAIIYYTYTRSNPADSNAYWRVAKNASEADYSFYLANPLGTNFMYLFNFFPSRILNLSIFSGTLFYSLISFFGFYYLYLLLKALIPINSTLFNIKLFPFLLFMPNFHFWSVGAGKDSLVFFSILALTFSILNLKNNKFLLIVSTLFLFFVRPHVFFIFLLSILIISLLRKKIKLINRITILLIAIALLFITLPIILNYVNLVNANDVQDILLRAEIQSNNLRGTDVGSSVNTSSYNFPLKVFSFLYRPLFIDYSGLFSLVSSFENLILLFLSIKVFNKRFVKALKFAPYIIKVHFCFFLLGTIMFSISLSNLGIYLRMKNMLIPSFIIFILWALSFTINQKNNKHGTR